MSQDQDATRQQTEPGQLSEHEGDAGVEITSGEPSTFEPEEDLESADPH